MLFAATLACPRCPARFSAREQCPTCGGTELSDLSLSQEQRHTFRRRVRELHGGGRLFGVTWLMALGRAAEWMPSRPWLTRVVGALLLGPATAVLLDPTFGRDFVVWHDDQGHLYSEYDGFSFGGLTLLVLGVAGLLIMASSFLRGVATAVTGRVARGQGRRPSLWVPELPAGDAVSMHGAVRGEARKTALLGGQPCVAFGLVGDVDGTPILDAEGDDFELETAAGERVLVRLQQALWRATPARGPEPTERTEELDAWLQKRGIWGPGACTLAQSVLREGDLVTVTGRRGKGKRAPGSYRDEPITTLEGTGEAPLVILGDR